MNARSNLAGVPVPVDVCHVSDLLPGIGLCALARGQQVAIFRLRDGAIHAVGNHDPFSAANVISRGLTGDLRGRKVVASPVYKQHFDLVTGQCLESPEVALPVYGVQVEGDRVFVLA